MSAAACAAVALPAPALAGTAVDDRIVFTRPASNGHYQVFSVLPDGTGARQHTELGRNAADPTRSPDGSSVAFVGGDSVRVVAFASGPTASTVVVTHSGEYVRVPTWSPAGDQIVYAASVGWNGDLSRPAPAMHLYSVSRTDGVWGSPRQLTVSPGRDTSPSWSPDGTTIAFSRTADTARFDERDLWTVPAAGGTPTQITQQPGGENSPDWHPRVGDNRLLYLSGTTLYTVPSTGGTSVRVGTGDGYAGSWSTKDPSRIVTLSNGDLKILQVATGKSTLLTRKASDRDPDW